MAKSKSALAHSSGKLATYKFDSSKYVMLKPLGRSATSSGRLLTEKTATSQAKAKSKK
jgi:hypothetical protein